MSIIEEYHLFMNSSQRVSGVNTNCNFSLYQPIRLKNPSNNFFVRIGSAEIPFTFNPINSTTNKITFRYVRNGVISSFFITIPQGSYNPTTFLSALQTQIAFQTVFTIFNFTYNSIQGFLSLTCKANDGVQTTLQITDCSDIVKSFLGINTLPSDVFGYEPLSQYVYLNSVKNVLFNPINSIYIRSENIRQSQNYESLVVKKDISDVLAKVQISVQPNNFIVWSNQTDLNVKVSNKYFDIINIYLTNNLSYDDLNLNGLDFSFRMTISEVGDMNIPKTVNEIEQDNLQKENVVKQETTTQLMSQKDQLIQQLLAIKEELLGSDGDQKILENVKNKIKEITPQLQPTSV
jgi:hypothetical protein